MTEENNIRDYLQDRLTPEERKTFERKLADDPNFAENYRQQAMLSPYIDIEIARNLKETLRTLDMDVEQASNSGRRSGIWKYLVIAAILGVCLWAAIRYQQSQVRQSSYAKYAMVDPTSFAMRGSTQELVYDFLSAHASSDMSGMKEKLADIPETYDRKTDLALLLAETLWRQGNSEEAKAIYDDAASIDVYRDKALLHKLYFLAKSGQDQAYQELYTQLAEQSEYPYSEELAQIEELRTHWLKRYLY